MSRAKTIKLAGLYMCGKLEVRPGVLFAKQRGSFRTMPPGNLVRHRWGRVG